MFHRLPATYVAWVSKASLQEIVKHRADTKRSTEAMVAIKASIMPF